MLTKVNIAVDASAHLSIEAEAMATRQNNGRLVCELELSGGGRSAGAGRRKMPRHKTGPPIQTVQYTVLTSTTPCPLHTADLPSARAEPKQTHRNMSRDSKPVALVIGASRGMGRQIAFDLATKHGYSGRLPQQVLSPLRACLLR